MKLVKMSLAAALLVSGAYALDNVKVNGSAKLIYQTTDVDNAADNSLFTHNNAAGGAQVLLGATADLVDNISAGAEVQVFSTMGLENNMVDGVMATASTADQYNMSQLWMAASYGKTTAKVGRMELDTPLAFTEKWNVAKNTFEAAVLINSDIENTTLVGAYVGKDNGNMNSFVSNAGVLPLATGTGLGALNIGQTAYMGGTNNTATFSNFYGGAYAVGAIYAGLENTTLQAWYYDVNSLAEAYWLQADAKLVDMVNVGVQYASVNPSDDIRVLGALTTGGAAMNATAQTLDAWAVKVSGTVSDINLFVAYSDVDSATGNALAVANTATQDKTKLYTGAGSIYMDGSVVGTADTQSWKIGASTKIGDYSLAANYTDVENDGNGVANGQWDVSGYDVSVGTKVGAIALKAIYTAVQADADTDGGANTSAVVPGYVLGSDRDTIRIIASVKF